MPHPGANRATVARVTRPSRHPAFRSARPASTAWNLAKTAIQTALFWLVFLGLGPCLLVRLGPVLSLGAWRFPGQHALALILFAVFTAINLTSGFVMARHGRGTPLPLDMANALVVVGPYRYLRNPMAVGGLGAAFAIGPACRSASGAPRRAPRRARSRARPSASTPAGTGRRSQITPIRPSAYST